MQMLSDSIRQEILDLMDRYGPETVLEAAEIAVGREYGRRGELGVALNAVKEALNKIKRAGDDVDKLYTVADMLDRAMHRVSVPWLWPLRKHFGLPLVKTGSFLERTAVVPAMLVLCGWLAWSVVR